MVNTTVYLGGVAVPADAKEPKFELRQPRTHFETSTLRRAIAESTQKVVSEIDCEYC